jgi:hypothetical protein
MNTTRAALLATLLVALTVAAGQALAAVPNVELVTFLVFVSGYLLGAGLGAVVGAAAMGIHSLFNVMGAAVPPVLAAQVAVYALVGVSGALLGPAIARARPGAPAGLRALAVGVTVTLGYQLAVNAAAFFAFTGGPGWWAYLWGGVVFGGVHVVWNGVLFTVALRPALAVLSRHRDRAGASP